MGFVGSIEPGPKGPLLSAFVGLKVRGGRGERRGGGGEEGGEGEGGGGGWGGGGRCPTLPPLREQRRRSGQCGLGRGGPFPAGMRVASPDSQ